MTSYLITGGTGSFGRAFCTELLQDPSVGKIVVFSRDELKQAEMAQAFPDPRMRFLIGSVTDQERVELAMRGIDNVIHAAAMKRVETCEANPNEATQTNLIGTAVVARACLQARVKRAVFLSTDKAVEPNTMYGTTKLAAERLWTRYNVYAAGTPTRYAATRYGNVLGSRGSVVGLWKGQAERGEPLTITHPDMSRFWMKMVDAVALVRLALREMQGGEVFIPKVGASSLLTLYDAMELDRCYMLAVGLRPGEKMHEALVGTEEARQTYDHGDHYRIELDRTWEDEPVQHGDKVSDGFSYRSDTCADQLTVERLREMI